MLTNDPKAAAAAPAAVISFCITVIIAADGHCLTC